jgi:hypothetical protein
MNRQYLFRSNLLNPGCLREHREADVNHLQAIVQIFAKDSFLDAGFQILVGGRSHSHRTFYKERIRHKYHIVTIL